MPKKTRQLDPTRTTTLRRRFVTDMQKRFNRLKKAIRELIVVEDAFGLKPRTPFSVNAAGTDGASLIGNTRWATLTNPQKVAAFRAWLTAQINAGVLEVVAVGGTAGVSAGTASPWTGLYIQEAYGAGSGMAFDNVRLPALQAEEFFAGSKTEFLRGQLGGPVAIEKVELIAARSFAELEGITAAMDQAIGRTLTEGFIAGTGPNEVAREITRQVDTIGRARARTLARTDIIRAHAEGNLDALEALGVEEIGVAVEWSTAGDDLVCPLCAPLEGVILKTSEAHGMFPRHPNCRCSPRPSVVQEPGQKRSRAAVKKALDKSVKAEIPKKSKRSVATQRKRSRWTGAGRRIGKTRPKGIPV